MKSVEQFVEYPKKVKKKLSKEDEIFHVNFFPSCSFYNFKAFVGVFHLFYLIFTIRNAKTANNAAQLVSTQSEWLKLIDTYLIHSQKTHIHIEKAAGSRRELKKKIHSKY